MLPGIVVINPGFIRADSKVGGDPPRWTWATFVPWRVGGDTKGKREERKGGQVSKKSVVSFKTSAVTIISGFRSSPFRFFNSAARRFRFEGISRKRYSSGLLISSCSVFPFLPLCVSLSVNFAPSLYSWCRRVKGR